MIYFSYGIFLLLAFLPGCMPLWFGIDCDMQCHCANNAECDVLTGVCPLGCENGWRGHNCQEVNFGMKKIWQSNYILSTKQ